MILYIIPICLLKNLNARGRKNTEIRINKYFFRFIVGIVNKDKTIIIILKIGSDDLAE